MSEQAIYVPFVLRLDQAEHAWGAVQAVIDSCKMEGRSVVEYAPLSAVLVIMERAIQKASE